MDLRLRKLYKTDLELVMNWRMKPEITKNLYTDPKLTLEMQYKWFDKISDDDTVKYWIIEVDNNSAGLLWLYSIDRLNKKCEWGYFIGDDSYRGKGLGRPLECNVYDYVFNVLELNKLHCEVFAFNDMVVKIHEKFGSEIEGHHKQHIFKNGIFYDVVSMAITANKWSNIKSQHEYDIIAIE